MWIVGGDWSAADWRDFIRPAVHGDLLASVMVLHAGPDAWAYYGPNAAIRCGWLKKPSFKGRG